ncbi:MAG: hypothetical protein SGJ11_18145 [Phycisphaerae bacterium]|nr:hypothetical protein [Phycisphaerae bacterium]
MERRIALIESDAFINLLERPEYRRRWQSEPWDQMLEKALRAALLDRVESLASWRDLRALPRTVAELNDALFDLVATMPKARSELIDFHFKHAVDEYLKAIQSAPGTKAVTVVADSRDAASAIRRAMIVADLVTFNVESYLGHPAIALLPIGDDVRSPVLGASEAIDAATGRRGLASVETWMYAVAIGAIPAAVSSDGAVLLGTDWTKSGPPRWQRTVFARLSDSVLNARGERCHVAGGAIHVQIPTDDPFLAEAQPLMRAGRLAFAPFVSSPAADGPDSESVLKSALLDSSLLSPSKAARSSLALSDPLLTLDVPYLENISLSTLAKVLDDEGDSVATFRRKLQRALEDVAGAKDDAKPPSESWD